MDAADATSTSALRAAHERFMMSPHRAPPSGVRRLVADSWQRCAASGVRPDGSVPPGPTRSTEDLVSYRRGHPLAAVLPLFRELLGEGAADDGHVFAVGDTDGTLLWVEGDIRAVRRAEKMHFAEGAVWSEAWAGTHAPGLCLPVRRGGRRHRPG